VTTGLLLGDWLLAARLALAGTLLLAAVAKAADRLGFAATLTSFGVPERLAPLGALLLPAVEAAIAVLLVPGGTALVGARAAAALLLFFTAVVAATLLRGRRPACRCFGPLSDDAIGPATLARNLCLAGVAVFVWWTGPGPGPLVWWAELPAAGRRLAALAIPAALALAGLSLVVAGQRRRLQDLSVRLGRMERMHGPADGLPPGAPAPRFALPTLAGGPASLDDLVAGGGLLTLVFLTPGCKHCEGLKSDIALLQERIRIAVLTKRDESDPRGIAPARVLLQEAWEVGERYRCEAVPSAVVVGPGPWIASLPVSGSTAVRSLLAELVADGRVPDWAREPDGE
jgi:uncharacterized membrane protein YphA (DoxX/SURF4 family)